MAEEDQKDEVVAHIDTKTEKRQLRFDLTDKELLDIGSEMSEAHQEVAELTSEMKAVQKDFKNKIEDIENKIEKHARLLRERYELREGEVKITLDYDAGTITVIRSDNGKEVESRKMNEAEAQRKMKLWPEGKTPSDDPNYEPPVSHVELHDAVKIIQEMKRGSITLIQRKMGLNERRAWMILDKLEELQVVGPPQEDGGNRELLMDEVSVQRFLEDYPERAEAKEVEDAQAALKDAEDEINEVSDEDATSEDEEEYPL